MRVLQITVLLLGGLLAGSPTALAEDPYVKADFQIGFGDGGKIVPHASRDLVPVVVVLENKFQGVSGRIEIRRTNPNTGGSEAVQIHPFHLSAPSTKVFRLLTRLEPHHTLFVKVFFNQRVPLVPNRDFHKVSPPHQALDVPKVLVLTRGLPSQFFDPDKFADEDFRLDQRYDLDRQTTARELPLDPLGYDGLHALMLSGVMLPKLTKPQRRALRDWIAVGGRLIIIQPAETIEFRKAFEAFRQPGLDLEKTGVYRCGTGLIACQVLKQVDDKPFWLEPELEPQALLLFPDMVAEQNGWIMRSSADAELMGKLTRPESTYGFMGFFWLLVIIGGYILVIGPVDYFIVKKTKKTWLTWCVFLSAIGLFSMIAYWYSGFVHAARMQEIYLNVLDRGQGEAIARGDGVFWIYSTNNNNYEITTKKQNVHFSVRESETPSSVAWAEVVNGDAAAITARIPVFSAKTFDATWLEKPLWRLHTGHRDGAETFTFENADDLNIRAVYLADAGGIQELLGTGKTYVPARTGRRSWNSFLEAARAFHGREGQLPERKDLDDYLLFLSFAQVPVAEAYEEIRQLRDERGPRERALDISHRLLGGGRVLLVFLEDDSSLLPITVNMLAPDSVHLNLVRLQLPPAKPTTEVPEE